MDYYDAWNVAVEEIKKQVTGVGVWTALNVAIPITLEDGVYVLGIPTKEGELKSHLTSPVTKRTIEEHVSKLVEKSVELRVIDGITINDWESAKRQRVETDRLRAEAIEKDEESAAARSQWDGVYEQISREYAAIKNKGMPQSRARLLSRCVALCVSALQGMELDESGDRHFARCVDRISTYCDAPATLVAKEILDKAALH